MKQPAGAAALRHAAEARLRKLGDATDARASRADLARLVHELQVYRVELEMQNEELRQARTDLQSAADRYRDLFEHSLDGVLLTRPTGEILAANPAAQRMFGYSEAEFRAMGRQGLVDATDQRLAGALAERERTGRFVGELTYLARDGRRVPVEVASALFADGDGRLLNSMIVRDITARQRAEDDMARLRAEMHQVLEWQVARHTVAALAHELNQPLASIAALSEAARRLLAADCASAASCSRAEPLGRTVAHLAIESERAGRAVRDLMASLHRPAEPTGTMALADLLREVVRETGSDGATDCRMVVDCPATVAAVRVNRLQVEKVLLNLIRNSRDALAETPTPNGRIRLAAALVADDANGATGAELCLTVHDDGPGIDAAMRGQLFHPFVTAKRGGMGLGLAISRALVEVQGGKLWYDADAGPGATFRFTLPVRR